MISTLTIAVMTAYAISAIFRYKENKTGVVCALTFFSLTYVVSFAHLYELLNESYVRVLYFTICLFWVFVTVRLRLILQMIVAFTMLTVDCVAFIDYCIYYLNSNYHSKFYDLYPLIMAACHLAITASLWGEGSGSYSFHVRRNDGFNNSQNSGGAL